MTQLSETDDPGLFQQAPADPGAVLDAVTTGRNFVGNGPGSRAETYKRPVSAPTQPWRMEDSELERLTAPISWAHLEGVVGPEADAAAAAYTRLRELRDRLDDADARFYAASVLGAAEPARAADAARSAIEAGLPVPVVVPTDIASAQATLRAENQALASMIRHASALYLNAAEKVAPAARARLAERLPEVIVAAKTFWVEFARASEERVSLVETLAELNRIVDPQYRDLLPDPRDRKLGGSLDVPGETVRARRRAEAAEAIDVLASILGSNDPLVTGSYSADAVNHGTWPVWFRRALIADGDLEQLAEIQRAEPVDLDAIPTPGDRYRASLSRSATPTTGRKR